MRYSPTKARRILAEVAAKHKLYPETLCTHMRFKYVVAARWEAWNRLSELGMSFNEIGRMTNHDHSTVIHGVRRYRKSLKPWAPGNGNKELTYG